MEKELALDQLAEKAINGLPLARRTPANIDYFRNQPEEVILATIQNDKDLKHNEQLQEAVRQFDFHFYGTVNLTINNYYSGGSQPPGTANYDYPSAQYPANYIPSHSLQHPPNINVDVNPYIYVEGSRSDSHSSSSQDNDSRGGILVLAALTAAIFLALALGASD